MSVDGERQNSVDLEVPVQLPELITFRDDLLFPAVDYLSHGTFDPATATAEDQFNFERVREVDGQLRRYGIEASCRTEMDIETGVNTVVSLRFMNETMLPLERCEGIKQEILETVDADDEIIDQLDDPEEPVRAWDTKYFVYENSPDTPGYRRKKIELQDSEGVVVWDEDQLEVADEGLGLTVQEKMALYEIKQGMAATLSRTDLEDTIEALVGLGLPADLIS